MNTLAQFKRELSNIKAMTLLTCSFDNWRIGQKRELAHTDTVQFSLWTEKKDGTKARSYIYYPKASGYSYNKEDDTVTIIDSEEIFVYKLHR